MEDFAYKVTAPCTGKEAIEQGKQVIMARLGTAAELVSYQENKNSLPESSCPTSVCCVTASCTTPHPWAP